MVDSLADGRYVRYDNLETCVFFLDYKNVTWCCYDAHDEEECLECFWIDVRVKSVEDCSQAENLQFSIDQEQMAIELQLRNWSRIKHPLVLTVKELTRTEDGNFVFITDMCGRNSLRNYRHLHAKLGCPAIRKISRQLIKALTKLSSGTSFPVHHVTAADIHINAATAAICVLPTFIWRRSRPTDNECHSLKRYTQVDLLRAWVAVVVELFTGVRTDDWTRDELLEVIEHVPDADAQTLLRVCLKQEEARELPLSELLEYVFLDTRQDVGLLARSHTQGTAATAYATSSKATHSDAGHDGRRGSFSSCTISRSSRQNSAAMAQHDAIDDDVAAVDQRFSAFSGALPEIPDASEHALREVDAELDAAASIVFRAGVVKGLDYTISANGSVDASGQVIDFTVRLMRTSSGMAGHGDVQVVRFPFDVRHDTVDQVASEMAPVIGMEETDVEMTAAAMREVIAQQLPGLERMWSFQVKEGSLPASSGGTLTQSLPRKAPSGHGNHSIERLMSTPEHTELMAGLFERSGRKGTPKDGTL